MTSAKYATPRDPDAPTLGARVAVVSEALGAPLMPWQRQVADVALELHPSTPGAWRYRLVIVTVPRQSGKTTLMRAVAIDRALAGAGAQVFITAQTGKDARARWRDWVKAVEAPDSPLASFAKVRRAAGSEALTFPNGSFVSPFAPTPKSLHGYTPPLVMVDEAWAFDAAAGSELDAAIAPAQITLPNRQLWIVSTAGDATSDWLRSLLETGRASLEDPDTDVAYFEWSAPDDVDPYAPEALEFHPAVGHTQTLEDLTAQAARESPGNWRRGYLNLWTRTTESILDLEQWDALAPATPHPAPPLSQCVVSYAVAEDRSAASVWAAHMSAGQPCLHLAATRSGSAWLAPVVTELYQRGPLALAARDSGHTRTVIETLETAGTPTRRLGIKDFATATASLLGRAEDRTIAHDGDAGLRAALECAALRARPDGRVFDPRSSAGPIDHLEAATVAAYVAEHQPAGIPIY